MSGEGETPTSKDLVAAAREQMPSEGGSSGAMVEAARRHFSEVESSEDQAIVGAGLGRATAVAQDEEQVVERPVEKAPRYQQEAPPSSSSGQRRGPSSAPQPVLAPPSAGDRTTARGVRRLIAIAVLGFVVFSVLNTNFEGIRDFVEEQLQGSTTSAGPQEEVTDAAPEEAQGAAELGGLDVDSYEFAEFPLPAGANPNGIDVGFDAVWYLDNHPNNKVGKLDPATGELLAQYVSPEPGLHGAIAIGFDAVWFAPEGVETVPFEEPAEVIFKLDPSDGSITPFPLPIDSGPSRMTTGFGYVWYTAIPHNAIGRLDPVTGDVVEYPIPTADSDPVGITTGFGAVWFTEVFENARKVGRLDPATGEITEYPMLNQTGAQCCGVATGFDAVWYTASTGNAVGRLDPATGQIVEYQLPNPGSAPVEIVAGPDAMWFTEIEGNRIGRLNPRTGAITEYPIPSSDPGPFGIAEGSIWFSASRGGSIGRLDP